MPTLHNKVGERFGRLLVKKRVDIGKPGVHWECQCDCGNETVVPSARLRLHGGTRSCGCLAREVQRAMRTVDRIGRRYGHSVVIAQADTRGGRSWWVLKCDCGNTFEKSAKNLRDGTSHNCGCKLRSREIIPLPGQLACEAKSMDYPQGRTGTYAGYQAHVKANETPCAPCDSARTEYNRQLWRRLSSEEREKVRQKNREACKLYSKNHPSRRRDVVDSRRRERIPIIREAKNKPCADCGVQYPYYVMQFDHVRGEKKFNIGGGWNNSIQAIQEEIAKCDVVCANCHAERTYQRIAGQTEEAEKQ